MFAFMSIFLQEVPRCEEERDGVRNYSVNVWRMFAMRTWLAGTVWNDTSVSLQNSRNVPDRQDILHSGNFNYITFT
jgi:hypothetical protein